MCVTGTPGDITESTQQFKPLAHQESLKIWDGPGDKIKLQFRSSVQPPTPGQGCRQLVDDLPVTPSE